MPRAKVYPAFGVLLACAVAGCGTLFGGQRESPFAGSSASQVMVFVENRNREDVNVEVASPTGRQAVGRVSGRGRGQFTVDWTRTQELRFEVNLVAGSRHTIRVGSVSPGDRVELFVAPSVGESFARRR